MKHDTGKETTEREFLNLSDADAQYIETKLALSRWLRQLREQSRGFFVTKARKKLGSSRKPFMRSFLHKLEASPLLARVAPFVIFAALTFFQGRVGEGSRYWLYLVKCVLGAWLIWVTRPWVAEMRWKVSVEGIVAGIAVFSIWVGLDGLYPKLGGYAKPWNPQVHFREESGLSWMFILTRVMGSTLIVPPMEEVFYRSFLYRYLVNADFQRVPLARFGWTPFLATAAIFSLAHFEWLPALLCAMAYQGLVIWKGRLGDAMTAHAVTNFLLGLWIIWQGAWHFW